MGLGIYTRGMEMYVGAYSKVQRIRSRILVLVIESLESKLRLLQSSAGDVSTESTPSPTPLTENKTEESPRKKRRIADKESKEPLHIPTSDATVGAISKKETKAGEKESTANGRFCLTNVQDVTHLLKIVRAWAPFKKDDSAEEYRWVEYRSLEAFTPADFKRLPFEIQGLFNFTNHSDCEGEWRTDECKAITDMFDQYVLSAPSLLNYLYDPSSSRRDTGDLAYYTNLRNVFARAYELGTSVVCE